MKQIIIELGEEKDLLAVVVDGKKVFDAKENSDMGAKLEIRSLTAPMNATTVSLEKWFY